MSQKILAWKEMFSALYSKMKYGAPELKQYYQKYLTRGLIVALLFHSVIIAAYFLNFYFREVDVIANDSTPIVITPAPDLIKQAEEEIPALPSKILPLKDPSSLTPEPVPLRNVKEDIILKSQDELEYVEVPVSKDGTDDIANVKTDAEDFGIDKGKIDKNFEPPAEDLTKDFKGHEVDMMPVVANFDQIKRSMKYPEVAIQTGEEGKVVVKILVDTDGTVKKILGVSGAEVFFDEVSEKAMNLVFRPAMKNNQTVKCIVSVPFSFKLSTKNKVEDTDDEIDKE